MISVKLLLPRFLVENEDYPDLNNYLDIFQPTLDWFHTKIGEVTAVRDLDTCTPEVLPYLSNELSYTYDYTAIVTSQRKKLKELIDYYRRRGSVWSFSELLDDLGIQGVLYNTIYKIMAASWQGELSDAAYFEDGWYIYEGSLELQMLHQMDETLYQDYSRLVADIKPAGFKIWLLGSNKIEGILLISNSEFTQTICNSFQYYEDMLSVEDSLSDEFAWSFREGVTEAIMTCVNQMYGHVGELCESSTWYDFADNPYSLTSAQWYNWQQEVQITQLA